GSQRFDRPRTYAQNDTKSHVCASLRNGINYWYIKCYINNAARILWIMRACGNRQKSPHEQIYIRIVNITRGAWVSPARARMVQCSQEARVSIELNFPDRLEEARRRGREFQTLPPDERVRQLFDTIETGLILVRESPNREAIDRLFL